HTDDEADRPGPADEAEEPVDEERRDPDVDQRVQFDLFGDRSEELLHLPVSVASGPVRSGASASRDGAGSQATRSARRGSSGSSLDARSRSRARVAAASA